MKKMGMIVGSVALLVLLGLGLTRLDAPKASTSTPVPKPSASTAKPVEPALPSADPRTETIARLMDGMTTKEKVGQLFFARCPEGDEAEQVTQHQFGGYVLFGRDFAGRTADSLRDMLADCQKAAKIPMLLGTDEEGGTVVRASAYPQFRESKFKSPQKLFKAGGMDAIVADTQEKAALLLDLGLNVNLAPVCDVSTNAEDYIYPRAFGKDAEATAEYVRQVVRTAQDAGLGSVLKHFPGYGNNTDTHTGIATDERPMEAFEKSDFLPFSAGIGAGAGCVLVSHNVVEAMDAKNPASLSPKVHEILRKELNFNRVVLTDDLAMDAIAEYTDGADAAVRALQAGNDMLISSDVEVQLPAVLAALADGTLPQARVDEAVTRVLGWKYDLGLLK